MKEENTPDYYTKRVECPKCESNCYWSAYPPRELRCSKCGYLVAKEEGLRRCDTLIGEPTVVDAQKRMPENMNG